jgi:Flp pilus assembly protein TadD
LNLLIYAKGESLLIKIIIKGIDMPKRLGRLALLYISTCVMTGCEGGTSRSSTRLDPDPQITERAAVSSPAEAVKRAETLRLAGADAAALGVLEQAYRRYPSHSGVQSAYGRLALAMGHDELAARLLESAVASDPEDWRALSAQGVLEWRGGRPSEARGALVKAKTLSAEDSAVLNNLAVSYLLENRAAEAASLLRQALASPSLNPAHAGRLRRNLAVALAVEGNFAEADRLAQAKLPRSLKHAGANAIRRFMNVSDAPANRPVGWEARFADARQDWPGAQ